MNNRILRIVTRLNVGGITKHLAWLSARLPEKDWRSMLLCGAVEADEDDMSYFVTDFGVEVHSTPSIRRSIDIWCDARAVFEVYKVMRKFRPNIVETHMSKAGMIGRTAVMIYNFLNREKIRTVHTFHGHTFHGYFSPIKQYVFLAIERFLAKHATDIIITLSSQQETEICDTYKVGKRAQYRQVNLGIDSGFSKILDRFHLRNILNIPNNSRVFGIVGRIAEIKNHYLFVDSARNFAAEHDTCNVRFVIVGDGDKEYVDALKLYARDVPAVIFAGNRTEPSQFYGALDCLVLTSKNEGTPVSILEAFACGIPVISTGVGGVIDLIGKDERGTIVEPSAKALSDAYFESLCKTDDERIERAQIFVATNYSLDKLVSNMNRIYRDLVSIN